MTHLYQTNLNRTYHRTTQLISEDSCIKAGNVKLQAAMNVMARILEGVFNYLTGDISGLNLAINAMAISGMVMKKNKHFTR